MSSQIVIKIGINITSGCMVCYQRISYDTELKSIVDFHCAEMLAIMVQPVRFGEIFRIKKSLPVVILITGCAYSNLRCMPGHL